MSLLLFRLLNLPHPCKWYELGNVGNLGSNKILVKRKTLNTVACKSMMSAHRTKIQQHRKHEDQIFF